jgi:hypothetical protein
MGRERRATGHEGRATGHEGRAMGREGRAMGHEGRAMGHEGRAMGHKGCAMGHEQRAMGSIDPGALPDGRGKVRGSPDVAEPPLREFDPLRVEPALHGRPHHRADLKLAAVLR